MASICSELQREKLISFKLKIIKIAVPVGNEEIDNQMELLLEDNNNDDVFNYENDKNDENDK
jgi:hypothetical protein